MDTRTIFPPALVADLISKVGGKSSLAKLSMQQPIPFNGMKEMVFTMDSEIDVVAENGQKSHGGITVNPVTVVPIKFEYGARVSDEFMNATEEEGLQILQAFNDGFAKKVARGLDIAALHGINPRTNTASTVIGANNFDAAVTQQVTYTAATADENLEAAIDMIDDAFNNSGIAMSRIMRADMAKIKANGVRQYPQFGFGAQEVDLMGTLVDVNSTVSVGTVKNRAYVGDFENAFKWGIAKDIPLEVIPYGDPDNTGKDLKGHNQVYLRAEVYIGWGILVPGAFARVVEA